MNREYVITTGAEGFSISPNLTDEHKQLAQQEGGDIAGRVVSGMSEIKTDQGRVTGHLSLEVGVDLQDTYLIARRAIADPLRAAGVTVFMPIPTRS